MKYKNLQKEKNRILVESIEQLIESRIKDYVRDFIKQKEVVVKKVYNENTYSLRKVDVVFTDDISESMPIKNLPVNLPYHIRKDDKAFLFYFDKPINGWVGNLIEYSDIVIDDSEVLAAIEKKIEQIETSVARLETQDINTNWSSITDKPTTLEGFGITIQEDDVPSLPTSKIDGLDDKLGAKVDKTSFSVSGTTLTITIV